MQLAGVLELHSNKARKLEVIAQLGKAWQATAKPVDDVWDYTTDKYKNIRDNLNAYVETLHKVHPVGFSIRTAISLAAANPIIPQLPIEFPATDFHTAKTYEVMLVIGDRLDLNLKQVGDLPGHPLSLIRSKTWSLAWQADVLKYASSFAAASRSYQEYHNSLLQRYQIPTQPVSVAFMNSLGNLAELLPRCYGKQLGFAFGDQLSTINETVLKLGQLLESFASTEAKLSCSYNRDKYLQTDLAPATLLWQKSITSWWLPRILNAGKCRKYLVMTASANQTPEPGNDLPLLEKLQQTHKSINDCSAVLSGMKGWASLESDVEQLTQLTQLASQIRDISIQLTDDPGKLLSIRQSIKQTVVDGNDLLGESGPLALECKAYLRARENFLKELNRFASTIGQQPDDLLNQAENFTLFMKMDEVILPMEKRLNALCAWQRVRGEAIDAQLSSVIQQLEDGSLPPGDTRRTIAVNYARWWANRMIDETSMLRDFVSIEHEQKISSFSALDKEVQSLTSQVIQAQLRQNTANIDEVKRNSEFGIIRREMEKKTRHKPLRQLLKEAPNAIPQLTPCFLMSPLSIAQYLPIDMKPFDVVIFDEASQITVWDAIGAIARGRQAIVVGDPKQLPPTNFFNSGQSPDEDSDVEEDLESILDEMLASNIPTVNLSWHYRSRHESLITFSNHRYYNGNLITFPSPSTQDTAVNLLYINGKYERSIAQVNRDEAQAIVKEIESRLLDSGGPKQTIGVVTFNQKQQSLILDMLDAARRARPELDQFFSEDLIEPVFVKNLEAVQGDERDVILFSTTFGPDAEGKLSMNFGPLNKNGGERRLNVAITRAKHELKVFTSLRSEQIDLSRTAALGVRDLKHFLEFAETHHTASNADDSQVSSEDSAHGIESAIARELTAKGWNVRLNVGVSRFRVNIAVVHPNNPSRYLAGIECDGATYQSSSTARDRDIVRESVLRSLGWQTLRVWSLDYWIDPETAISKLDSQLRGILENS